MQGVEMKGDCAWRVVAHKARAITDPRIEGIISLIAQKVQPRILGLEHRHDQFRGRDPRGVDMPASMLPSLSCERHQP
jgi:hypothetical protein